MPATTATYNEGSWEPIEKNPIESKRERFSRRESQRKGIYGCITILEVNALADRGHPEDAKERKYSDGYLPLHVAALYDKTGNVFKYILEA